MKEGTRLTEEEIMYMQELEDRDFYFDRYLDVPAFLLDGEIGPGRRNVYFNEMRQVRRFYHDYLKGARFLSEGTNGDYVPADLRYRKAALILNKEARFFFSNPPTFSVNKDDVVESRRKGNAVIQRFLDRVLEKNNFSGNVFKALKDCFIGKRIAIVVNFNGETGITLTFLTSFEFVYETSGKRDGELTRFVSFYEVTGAEREDERKWFKKVYTKEQRGVYLEETVWSADGKLAETVTRRTRIKLDYIPAFVVLNDGLTGDECGSSEMQALVGGEKYYSKLANADMDALRKSMNPIRYTIDVSQRSSEKQNLPTSPGSYWDLQSDEEKVDEKVAKVGVLEPAMHYSEPLKNTLARLENEMYAEADVPNITSEQLAGTVTSEKSIQALYWGLTVRCDEKMLAWGFALRNVAETVLEGARLYPESARAYFPDGETSLPDIPVKILVENNYPIPKDVNEEKQVDIMEVEAKVLSKKAYIKKWRGLSDEDADRELEQIAKEQELFENSLATAYNGRNGTSLQGRNPQDYKDNGASNPDNRKESEEAVLRKNNEG